MSNDITFKVTDTNYESDPMRQLKLRMLKSVINSSMPIAASAKIASNELAKMINDKGKSTAQMFGKDTTAFDNTTKQLDSQTNDLIDAYPALGIASKAGAHLLPLAIPTAKGATLVDPVEIKTFKDFFMKPVVTPGQNMAAGAILGFSQPADNMHDRLNQTALNAVGAGLLAGMFKNEQSAMNQEHIDETMDLIKAADKRYNKLVEDRDALMSAARQARSKLKGNPANYEDLKTDADFIEKMAKTAQQKVKDAYNIKNGLAEQSSQRYAYGQGIDPADMFTPGNPSYLKEQIMNALISNLPVTATQVIKVKKDGQ